MLTYNGRNLSILVDFYELTMANNFMANGKKDEIACFDVFFRDVPDNGGYCIMAGLEQVIEFINNIYFSEEDIEFLRSKNIFNEEFLEFLRDFKFSCDVFSIEEGYPIFPKEPILTVRGPILECLLIETMLLLTLNHQILISTKASRICMAAKGRNVLEFGARRAQGYDGAIYGSRAAVIGGCVGTSCTLSEKLFSIKSYGTMAHSWIQMFDNEYEAFKSWAKYSPDNCILLIDTYNVLKSGLPNAVKVFKEMNLANSKNVGVRIDSGDITYLTKKVRKVLDNEGLSKVKIIVSNSLDEHIITDVLSQGAEVDMFGVGERLITSKSSPVLGGVYKLCATYDENNNLIPKIKISENSDKITISGFKTVYRIFDSSNNMAIADLITNFDETICESEPLVLFDPVYTWKKKIVKNFYAVKLHKKIFDKGKCVYKSPDVMSIREIKKREIEKLWPEITRLENPQKYFVDLSETLWKSNQELLNSNDYI